MKYELEPDNRNCPDDVLLDDMRSVAVRMGKSTLTKDEYNKNGRFSAATMQNRFGSWNNALLKCNLMIGKRNRIPHQEILDDLKKVAEKTGEKSVSVESYRVMGKFSAPTVSKAFGSWSKAMSAAGLDVSAAWHPKVSDDELLSNLAKVWETLGRQPKQNDLRKPLSCFSSDTYKRRFGSWRNSLEFFVKNTGDDSNFSYEKQKDIIYYPVDVKHQEKRLTQRDPSWRMRFLVNRRDRFSCRACGRSPANDVGVVLHVDHVIPWSKGGETIFENLQTLCEKCNLGKSDLPMYVDHAAEGFKNDQPV